MTQGDHHDRRQRQQFGTVLFRDQHDSVDRRDAGIDLQIDFDGALSWNRVAVDRATMQRYISLDALKSPQPEVHIAVDRFAKYEVVAQTLADFEYRGLKKIGFVNEEFF